MFWEKPGKDNTENTLQVAVKKASEKKISSIVVASNEGDTMFKLLEQDQVKKLNLVMVTHRVGFKKPGFDELTPEVRNQLEDAGVKIYTGTHLLAGVARSLRFEYGGIYPPEIMANTLRMFGQGVKVCLEIAIMSLDAGLIPYNEEIIAIGGTGRGADTAVVIQPAHSNNVFKTRVKEIICRPKL